LYASASAWVRVCAWDETGANSAQHNTTAVVPRSGRQQAVLERRIMTARLATDIKPSRIIAFTV
jgi:hypothetical protein